MTTLTFAVELLIYEHHNDLIPTMSADSVLLFKYQAVNTSRQPRVKAQ